MSKGFKLRIKGYRLSDCIRLPWFYLWGHILGALFYERKYCTGKYFRGRLHGLAAPGWRWVCHDAVHRNHRVAGVPWPCSPDICVTGHENIEFSPDDINNFQGVGNYFQAINGGRIVIGKGTWIAMGVGMITSNHNLDNPEERGKTGDIILGEACWVGMNAMILPGVELGPHTVVGAGAVVTKSFKDGHCVIAGNPARLIKRLDQAGSKPEK